MNEAEPKPLPAKPAPEGKAPRRLWLEQLLSAVFCPLVSIAVGFLELVFQAGGPVGPGFGILMIQSGIAMGATVVGFLASFVSTAPRAFGTMFAVHAAGNLVLGLISVAEGHYVDVLFFALPALATAALSIFCFYAFEKEKEKPPVDAKIKTDDS